MTVIDDARTEISNKIVSTSGRGHLTPDKLRQVLESMVNAIENHSVPLAQIADASNNGRALVAAASFEAMKVLLAIAKSDVAGLNADLAALAPLASPQFSGTPTAPTAADGTSTTQIATTAFVWALLNSAETQVASASTTDISAATSIRVAVTGSTTITSLGATKADQFRVVRFAGTPVITHNGISLALPTAGNITAAAGDVAAFASDNSGNWRCLWYTRGNGTPLAGGVTTLSESNVLSALSAGAYNPVAAVGSIAFFARNAAPAGYLKANGAAISRTSYADLFQAIGTTFGAGDGSTTFNVPDMRGEFPRGWDDGRGIDSGRSFGSAQGGAIEAHSHSGVVGNTASGSMMTGGSTVTPVGNYSIGSTGTTETRPRNLSLLACIKF